MVIPRVAGRHGAHLRRRGVISWADWHRMAPGTRAKRSAQRALRRTTFSCARRPALVPALRIEARARSQHVQEGTSSSKALVLSLRAASSLRMDASAGGEHAC